MKSKSIINIKKRFAAEIAAGVHGYGATLAESYWKQDSAGFIIESQPVTSEILNGFFYPATPSVKDNGRVYVGRWFTGVIVEEITGPGGVHTERIKFKPDEESAAAPEFIESQIWENIRQHQIAND